MRGYRQHSHAASDAPVAVYHRFTPLFLAFAVNGTTALVNLLLVHGADVNATVGHGCGAHAQLMNPHVRVTVWVGVRACVNACVCARVRACVSNKNNWAFEVCLPVYLSAYLSINLSICLSTYLSVYLSISIHASIHLSI